MDKATTRMVLVRTWVNYFGYLRVCYIDIIKDWCRYSRVDHNYQNGTRLSLQQGIIPK